MPHAQAQRMEELWALERENPLLHSVHVALGLAWVFAAGFAHAPEGILFAPLMAVWLARMAVQARGMLRAYSMLLCSGPGMALVAWRAYEACSTLWAPATPVSLSSILFPRPFIALLMLWPLAARWRMMLGAFAAGGAASAGVTVAGALLQGKGLHGRDPILLMSHQPSTALTMAVATVVAFALFAHASAWRGVLAGGALALLSFGGMVLVAARTMVAAVAAGAVAVMVRPMRGLGAGARLRRGAAMAVLAAAVVLLMGQSLSERTQRLVKGEGTVAKDSSGIEVALKRHMGSRGPLWLAAADLWTQRPLFGWGNGAWREVGGRALRENPDRYGARPYLHSEIDELPQPHNAFLEVLFSGGFVGFALFAWMLAAVAVRLWRKAALDCWGSAALATLTAWLVAGVGTAVGSITIGAILLSVLVLIAAVPTPRRAAPG